MHAIRVQPKKIKVLTLDGGGTRGIITVQALRELQKHIDKANDRHVPIAKYFDIIGGTSTGGIIASALVYFTNHPEKCLTTKSTATGEQVIDTIEEVYRKMSTTVFPNTWRAAITRNLGFARITYPGDADGLEVLLKKTLGAETLMSSLGKVFVTALRNNHKPVVIRGYECPHDEGELVQSVYDVEGTSSQGDSWKVWEALRATSAAPVFLKGLELVHKRIGYDNHVKDSYTDGGQWANNPSYVALREARCRWGPDVDIELFVTLGTGRLNEIVEHESKDRKGTPSIFGNSSAFSFLSAIDHAKWASKLSLDTFIIHRMTAFHLRTHHPSTYRQVFRFFQAFANSDDPNYKVLKRLDASDEASLQRLTEIGREKQYYETTNLTKGDQKDHIFANLPKHRDDN
jgi:predicted acylesterase/phospholipase RssA